MVKRTTEKTIEKHLCEGIISLGGIPYKFTSPNRRNVPDRLCVLPQKIIFFVECKASGEKLRSGQVREIQRLRKRGHIVLVFDSKRQTDILINKLAIKLGIK